jgi:hypothetical protein
MGADSSGGRTLSLPGQNSPDDVLCLIAHQRRQATAGQSGGTSQQLGAVLRLRNGALCASELTAAMARVS